MKPKRQYKPGTIDDCQTPGYALKPIARHLNDTMIVWECASGEGLLAKEIQKYVREVRETDIKYGVDFLDFDSSLYDLDFDCIITNPPFSLKFDWIKKCYEFNKPWALLLPVETIGAKSAQQLFKTHYPEIGIIYMDKRIKFKMPNIGWENSRPQFPVAWYTWKFGFKGNRFYSFDWLTKEIRESYEL